MSAAALVAFVRARLDEDERYARQAAAQQGTYFQIKGWAWWDADWGGYHLWDPHEDEQTDVGMPARVLRDVAAWREIVDECQRMIRSVGEGLSAPQVRTLRALAAVYDQHPAYRQEWTP